MTWWGRMGWIVRWDAVIVLAVTPLSMIGGWRSTAVIPVLAALFVVRRISTGYFGLWGPFRFWIPGFVLMLPLTLLPSSDLAITVARLSTVVAGVALMTALGAMDVSGFRRTQGVIALVIAVAGGLALVSPFVVDWPTYKAPIIGGVNTIIERFPLLLSGSVSGTVRGGIHPIELAGLLTLVLPAALIMAIDRHGGTRIVLAAAFALGTVALILTQSRSGLMGAAIGLMIIGFWWFVFRATANRRWIAFVGGTVGVAAVWWLTLLAARWFGSSERGLDSFASRQELWLLAVILIRSFPITGIGPGQLSLVLHTLAPPVLTPPTAIIVHAHNGYLQAALDFGLPATLCLFALLGIIGRNLIRSCQVPGIRQTAAVGILAGLVGFGVFSLTDAISFTARGAIILWAILGLGLSIGRPETAARSDD